MSMRSLSSFLMTKNNKKYDKKDDRKMKKTKSTAFSKARIEVVDGEFLIVEAGKKDAPDKIYSLSNELEEWVGVEGVSLSIKKDEDVAPDEIVEPTLEEFIED